MTVTFTYEYDDFDCSSPETKLPARPWIGRGALLLTWLVFSLLTIAASGAYMGTHVAWPWWIATVLPMLFLGMIAFHIIRQIRLHVGNLAGSRMEWEQDPANKGPVDVSVGPAMLEIRSPRCRYFVQWRAVTSITRTGRALWIATAEEMYGIPKRIFASADEWDEYTGLIEASSGQRVVRTA